jgi:cytochrome bd-type quinol oxidase subunit 1
MAISGIVGSFCVVSANAWMNYPTGFTIRNGVVTDVNPWAAMFNPLAWLQFLHMWLAAFILVGLVVSGVYAAGLLRGRTDAHHRLGFTVPFVFASVAAVIQPFVGHLLGLQVGHKQPSKLAAFELGFSWCWEQEAHTETEGIVNAGGSSSAIVAPFPVLPRVRHSDGASEIDCGADRSVTISPGLWHRKLVVRDHELVGICVAQCNAAWARR